MELKKKAPDAATPTADKLVAESRNQTLSEKLNVFYGTIAAAQSAGEDGIEVDQEIMDHFNRKGLNGAKYFIYGNPGIKVYPMGQKEAIEAHESRDLGRDIFGDKEGVREVLP